MKYKRETVFVYLSLHYLTMRFQFSCLVTNHLNLKVLSTEDSKNLIS